MWGTERSMRFTTPRPPPTSRPVRFLPARTCIPVPQPRPTPDKFTFVSCSDEPKAGQKVLDELVLRSSNVVCTQALRTTASGTINHIPKHEGFDTATNDTAAHQPQIHSPFSVQHVSQ